MHTQHWPLPAPRAVVLFVHGMGEHIGRYEPLAAWLNSLNIAAAGYDQRGHGQTPGKRGHFNRLTDLMDDLDRQIADLRTRYGAAPVYLYAQSMGGNLALNYILDRKPDIAGAIVSSPWIQLAFEPPRLKKFMARKLRALFPALTLGNGLNTQHLSRDPSVVEAYNRDPLVHDRISAAAGVELMDSADRLHHWSGVFPVRLLLMHGSGDQITSAPASRAFAGRAQGDVTFKEWPGLYHELHFEPEKEAVRTAVAEWLEG